MPSEQDLVERTRVHLAALRELIEGASEALDDAEIETKALQLATIQRSIASLEKGELPVPKELRQLKMRLTTEVARREEAIKALHTVRDELTSLLRLLRPALGRRRSTRSRGSSRVPAGPSIDVGLVERAILEVLGTMGGSGRASEVIDKVFEIIKDEWTPFDLSNLDSGLPRWRNRVSWAKYRLVQRGDIRRGSPHGIWDLVTKLEHGSAPSEEE